MGSMSIWHWVILLTYFVAFGVPIAKILGRLGYSKALTIVAFIPLLNVIGLWILAGAKWPISDDSANQSS